MGSTPSKKHGKSATNFSDVKAAHDIHNATSRSRELHLVPSLLNSELSAKSSGKVKGESSASSSKKQGPGEALQLLVQGSESVPRRDFPVPTQEGQHPVRAFVISHFLTEAECML
jgi:hypothetical protein